jgi:hypothetical protein
MKIEVLCLYMSGQGRMERYIDLCNRKGWIDEEEQSPSGFWCSYGGFSITIDKYHS